MSFWSVCACMRRISGIRNTVGPELKGITCTSMISGSKGDTRKSANMQGELLRDYQHPDVVVYGYNGELGDVAALLLLCSASAPSTQRLQATSDHSNIVDAVDGIVLDAMLEPAGRLTSSDVQKTPTQCSYKQT